MTKFMITSRRQNVMQNQNLTTGNLSSEKVENFKYLGVTLTNMKDIREEIKRKNRPKHGKCVINMVGWLVSNVEHLTMKAFALLHSNI